VVREVREVRESVCKNKTCFWIFHVTHAHSNESDTKALKYHAKTKNINFELVIKKCDCHRKSMIHSP
jgi:hypothetical protein